MTQVGTQRSRWRGGTFQSMEVRGFSSRAGTPSELQTVIIRHESLAHALPSWIFARPRLERLGIPQMCDALRMGPRELPSGPWRARGKDEPGVPNHTPATHPDVVQPMKIFSTLGFSKSNGGPARISKDRTPWPFLMSWEDTPPRPENNSRKRRRRSCCVSLLELMLQRRRVAEGRRSGRQGAGQPPCARLHRSGRARGWLGDGPAQREAAV